MPYLGHWINTAAQVIYAYHRGIVNMLMGLVANGLGLMLATISLLVFGLYAADPEVWRRFSFAMGATLSATVVGAALTHFTSMDCSSVPSPRCWWAAVVLVANIAMYVSPCLIFRHVWRTKSAEFMPLSVAFGGLFCSVTWMVYGICLQDPAVYGPNLLGVLLSLLQLLLYMYISCMHPSEHITEAAIRKGKDTGGPFT